MNGKTQVLGQNQTLLRLLILAAFFFIGVCLGQAAATRVPSAAGSELHKYLADFLRLESDAGLGSETVLSTVLL